MIDILDVETYVAFESQDELDMLSFLFGGESVFNDIVDRETWETIILKFSLYIYQVRRHLLQCYTD